MQKLFVADLSEICPKCNKRTRTYTNPFLYSEGICENCYSEAETVQCQNCGNIQKLIFRTHPIHGDFCRCKKCGYDCPGWSSVDKTK